MGSLLAVCFYRLIKVLEYETANPGQDFNKQEARAFTFDEDNAVDGTDVLPTSPEELRVLSRPSTDPDRVGGKTETSGMRSSSGSSNHDLPVNQPGAGAYRAGPDAERGELGGNYTVSGLK
jgi:hypothetical protein